MHGDQLYEYIYSHLGFNGSLFTFLSAYLIVWYLGEEDNVSEQICGSIKRCFEEIFLYHQFNV